MKVNRDKDGTVTIEMTSTESIVLESILNYSKEAYFQALDDYEQEENGISVIHPELFKSTYNDILNGLY